MQCAVEAANADEVIERVEDFDPVQLTKLANASEFGHVRTTCTCLICQLASILLLFFLHQPFFSVDRSMKHGVLHTRASPVLYIARKLYLETFSST